MRKPTRWHDAVTIVMDETTRGRNPYSADGKHKSSWIPLFSKCPSEMKINLDFCKVMKAKD